ncbi:Ku protein [Brevibacillus humidisoli]|uniref:non-homologous end joining protein Ku n=1 Tax=Brevibacillus humidisoli TaxID=2895522 RepID=UPI001E5BB467|nr:Ku protein [Brevibacillus humidisoli]UFJ42061.1 Ku protein [Brevibacillus humidisoli]
MHTVWKGSISFGLVNIPIRMFTATEHRDVRFRQLHKECNTPIRYTKTCPTCDREVDASEIVRGFEYEKDNFVIIQDEDLDSITPETRKVIEILDFVQLTEIDPIYFEKSYFLSPQDTGEKAYTLLREAMRRTGRIAIAQITLRNRQSLAAIRIYGPSILLETIYYPDEVRAVSQVPALPEDDVPLAENELSMAEQLIENMSTAFDPGKYSDHYRQDLHELIEKKLEGQEVAAAPAAPKANVIDLMQALKESIAAAENEGVGRPAKLETEASPGTAAAAKPAKKTKAEQQPAEPKKTTTKKLKRKKTAET